MKNMEKRKVGGGEDGTQKKGGGRRRTRCGQGAYTGIDRERDRRSWEHKQVCRKQKHTHRALNTAYLHRLVVLTLSLSVPPHHIMRREKCEMAI